jgi:hypothetical protein
MWFRRTDIWTLPLDIKLKATKKGVAVVRTTNWVRTGNKSHFLEVYFTKTIDKKHVCRAIGLVLKWITIDTSSILKLPSPVSTYLK